MNKNLIKGLSLAAAFALMSGCASNEDKNLLEDKIVIYEANDINSDELSEDKLIGLEANTKGHSYIDRSEIIIDDSKEVYPPRELLDTVDATSFNNQKLIDIIRILTSDFKETSVFLDPNVDGNIMINQRVGKMSIYQVIKAITKRVGYNAYYDEKEKALIVSPYVTRKYNIPAGIFVKSSVEQKLGTEGGSASATIELTPEDPAKVFENSLAMLGSSGKLVNFDKDAGMLMIKEHPHLINEIDNYVVDFVKDRSRKFIIEIAVFDIKMTKGKSTGFNITDLTYGIDGKQSMGLQGGLYGGTVGYRNDQQKSYSQDQSGAWTSVIDLAGTMADGITGRGAGLNFGMALQMMQKRDNIALVDKSKAVLPNHSVSYLGSGTTKNYVSAVTVTPQSDGANPIVNRTYDQIFDGVSFVSRVDSFPNKDYIEVSLAPSVTSVTIIPGDSSNPDQVEKQITETMNKSINIKSGELIVLGGLVRDQKSSTKENNPFLEDIPVAGDIFSMDGESTSKIETVFLVQVTELNDVKQTYDIPSYRLKDRIEQSF